MGPGSWKRDVNDRLIGVSCVLVVQPFSSLSCGLSLMFKRWVGWSRGKMEKVMFGIPKHLSS